MNGFDLSRKQTGALIERASGAYVVRPYNKDGSVSRARMTRAQRQLNVHLSYSAACSRRTMLEARNPGTRYAVEFEKGVQP